MARFVIVPDDSTVHIDARSSLHPIRSRTKGLEGFIDVALSGSTIDPAVTPRGHLSLRVEKLASGNPLEDRELRRRIDARRYPTIEGELIALVPAGTAGCFVVGGDVTFMGVTKRYESEMSITSVAASSLRLAGQSTFDVRDFGMEPPRILMLRVEPLVKVRVDITARAES